MSRKYWQRSGLAEDKETRKQLVHIVQQELAMHSNNTWTSKLQKLSHKENTL